MSPLITNRGPEAPSSTAPWAPLSLDPNLSMIMTAGSCFLSSSLTADDSMAPPGSDDGERGGVVGPGRGGRQRIGQRAGHGVTDQAHRYHPLVTDQSQQPVRVVPVVRVEHGGAPHHERVPHHPLRVPVHQRCHHQHDHPVVVDRVEPAGQLVGSPDRRATPSAPAHGGEEDVLLAPDHPLGHPGGTTRVERRRRRRVSGDRSGGRARRTPGRPRSRWWWTGGRPAGSRRRSPPGGAAPRAPGRRSTRPPAARAPARTPGSPGRRCR